MAETEQSAIHVVLTFDDNFWAPAFAVARSICLTTTRKRDLVLHLIHDGLKPERLADFAALVTEFGCSVRHYRAPRPRRVQRDLPLAAGRSPAPHRDVRAAPPRPPASRRHRRARSISTATRWCLPRSSGCSNGTSRARPSARSAIRCGWSTCWAATSARRPASSRAPTPTSTRACCSSTLPASPPPTFPGASRSSAATACSTSSTSTRTCST